MESSREKSKKLRVEENNDSSQLFVPFRAIGLVTTDIPFVLQSRGNEHFVICGIGHSFHVYRASKLNLALVGPQHEKRIRAIAALKDFVFVGSGNKVFMWKKGKLIRFFELPLQNRVSKLYIFGDMILVYSEEDKTVRIWNIFTGEVYNQIKFKGNFHLSSIVHPETYLNKVLFGSTEGTLQLWNLKTMKMIYSFKGWGSGVTCLEQSPAVDVIGIGLSNGKTLVHNIKLDKTVVDFHQSEGAVVSLSFRTDNHPLLVTASAKGSIALWDLENKKLRATIPRAHHGSVVQIKFLNAEPVMITGGSDNALKMWIFDQPDGTARLLRSRDGHNQTPSKIRYYAGKPFILSASQDRTFRLFNTWADHQNREISQGKTFAKQAKRFGVKIEERRLTPIVDFDSSDLKEREWDNIITCHEDDTCSYTWNFEKKVAGKHSLASTDTNPTPVKCVALSSCGNFGITGSASGWLEKFNMQSGIHRGVYKDESGRAHQASIQGICVDAMNRKLISASLDGIIKIWNFQTHKLEQKIEVGYPIDRIAFHKDNGLLSIVADDFSIRVFDIDTLRMVRKFEGHQKSITDMVFSPDGRWLVTASSDTSVRVWDLPSARMVDWFRVKGAVKSITFSAGGDFLVASMIGTVGLFMWSNQMHFSKVFLKPVPKLPPLLKTPTLTGLTEDELRDEDSDDELPEVTNVKQIVEKNVQNNEVSAVENEDENPSHVTQISENLITLSALPKARWQNLANIDLIKKRNKPIEPPKKPEKAPFFLPTQVGADDPIFLAPKADEIEDEISSRILHFKDLNTTTPFVAALEEGYLNGNYSKALEHLKKLSPSAIDFEFQVLSNLDDFKQLKLIFKMLEFQLDSNRDYELVQAYLNVFLKYHMDTIAKNTELLPFAESLREKQRESWLRLQNLFHNNLCLVQFFSSIQT